jgi:hypothetical protein
MEIGIQKSAKPISLAQEHLAQTTLNSDREALATLEDGCTALRSAATDFSERVKSFVGGISVEPPGASSNTYFSEREKRFGEAATVARVYGEIVSLLREALVEHSQTLKIKILESEGSSLKTDLQKFTCNLIEGAWNLLPHDLNKLTKSRDISPTVSLNADAMVESFRWVPNPDFGKECTGWSDEKYIDHNEGDYESNGCQSADHKISLNQTSAVAALAKSLYEKARPSKELPYIALAKIPDPEGTLKQLKAIFPGHIKSQIERQEYEIRRMYSGRPHGQLNSLTIENYEAADLTEHLINSGPSVSFPEVESFRRMQRAVATK